MINALLIGVVATLTPLQNIDTTFAVRSGARLEVENHRGSVDIETWSRDQISVRADSDRRSRTSIEISTRGGRVTISTEGRRSARGETDIELVVPEWMDIRVEGTHMSASIRGVRGDVSVSTTHGDIDLEGGDGSITLVTTQGDMVVVGASGTIRAASTNGDIEAEDIDGDIDIGTVNGEITLVDVRSEDVNVETLNGDVEYDGSINPAGRYSFSTHNGDIDLEIPEDTNANVFISTARGEFVSDCPVTLSGRLRGGKELEFTIGNGSAEIHVSSFGGTVSLSSSGGRCW